MRDQPKPNALCKTAAGLITFVGIPILATSPLWITYLFIRDIQTTIEYVFLAAFAFLAAAMVLIGTLIAVPTAVRWAWKTIAEPIAARCERHWSNQGNPTTR